MPGYAQPILDSRGMEALSSDIPDKPFTEATLLARVWETISRPAGDPGGPRRAREPASPASRRPAPR
jgi:hypothetical protein